MVARAFINYFGEATPGRQNERTRYDPSGTNRKRSTISFLGINATNHLLNNDQPWWLSLPREQKWALRPFKTTEQHSVRVMIDRTHTKQKNVVFLRWQRSDSILIGCAPTSIPEFYRELASVTSGVQVWWNGEIMNGRSLPTISCCTRDDRKVILDS